MLHNFKLISGGIDVAPVLAELDAAPDLWGTIPYRAQWKDTPHAAMQDIWFHYADPKRYAPGDLPAMANEHIPIWYRPQIDRVPSVRRIVHYIMSLVDGEAIGLVMVTKIPPGGEILPHADWGWHCQYHDKYYVPLQSDDGAIFGCSHKGVSEEIETRPGTCWLMDNRRTHWVRNASERDRLMLIVCAHSDKFNAFHERA